MNQEKIGKFIADLRKHKKLTQTELAKRIGVSNKTVSKWECGNAIPDYGVFENLCKEFNITVNELLNGEKDKKDDKVIGEYMKMKGKENRNRIIIISVISVLVVLCSFFGIYFINSYDKTNMYLLSGETENFKLKNGILVTSNVKNIFQNGDLITRDKTIEKDDILEIFYAVKIDDEYYKFFEHFDMGLYEEEYGEESIIPLDKIKYLPDNLYLIISFIKDEKMFVERMEINARKIFRNNKFLNTKVDKNYDNVFELIDIDKMFDPFKYRDQLFKDGFRYLKKSDNISVNVPIENLIIKDNGKEKILIDYINYKIFYFYDSNEFSIQSVLRNDSYGIGMPFEDEFVGCTDLYLGTFNNEGHLVFSRLYSACENMFVQDDVNKDVMKMIERFKNINKMYLYKEE